MEIFALLRVDDSAWDDSVNRYGLVTVKLVRREDGQLYWKWQSGAWGRFSTVWDRRGLTTDGLPVISRVLVRVEKDIDPICTPYIDGDI